MDDPITIIIVIIVGLVVLKVIWNLVRMVVKLAIIGALILFVLYALGLVGQNGMLLLSAFSQI